ncbi:MAG: hypothetical protein WAW86_07985 [Gammaproteobacteria bacterium]
MKLTRLLPLTAVLFLSSVTFAKSIYSENDIKTFSETNSCEMCNLSDAFLSKNHRNARLAGANLSNARISGDYNGAAFRSVFNL